MKRRCPKCGAELEIKGPIGFREECPECAAFMHTCVNCRLFDAPAGVCRSPTTEAVRDRTEINFCEEFEFGPGEAASASGTGAPPRQGTPAPRPTGFKPLSGDDARRRFDDLFRDSKE